MLDVCGAYNLIRIAEDQKVKTAFYTCYSLSESLVMPLGLTDSPASFQRFIIDVLRPLLDLFVIAYLDDTLVFSDNLKNQKKHVRHRRMDSTWPRINVNSTRPR